jgi:hypothetical protein
MTVNSLCGILYSEFLLKRLAPLLEDVPLNVWFQHRGTLHTVHDKHVVG